MGTHFDIVIVGAGMAGASLAAEVASRESGRQARILIIEAEDRPGYHTTGRSAAFWSESYGGPGIQPLTTASGPALHDLGVLTPRGSLTVARAGEEAQVEDFAAVFTTVGVQVDLLDRSALESYVPGLRDQWTCGAIEPSCCDIDVAGLHQHYLTKARMGGVELRVRSGLVAIERTAEGWDLALAGGARITCGCLVNSAGAWADDVAAMAGMRSIGIIPFRRTVAQLSVVPVATSDLPLVMDVNETFYFKPENGRIWVSPHDETPSLPCDAAAEEIDVALAVSRLEDVVDWQVQRVEHRWAGLRSFAPDRLPVFGYDPRDAAFFWFAGQGGFGIQTAPAAAELGARLLTGEPGGQIDPGYFSPARFG